MAEVYVRTARARAGGGALPVVSIDTSLGVRLTIGSTAQTSSALSGGVYFVSNSVACHIAVGADPTAVAGATSLPLFGASQLVLMVKQGHKISVIRDSTDGYLSIVPARAS